MVVVKRVTVDANLLRCQRLSGREITRVLPGAPLSWPLPPLLGGAHPEP
ncbi:MULTISPECIES: hypothetical protein [Actinosynnema]|nr:hypothetical protein [Actinosynnema pretiosum]MCP2098451.1 hypothetical protein [Actinosynnema pretiosum]